MRCNCLSKKQKASKPHAEDSDGGNAVVLHPFDKTDRRQFARSPEAALAEAAGLTRAIGLTPRAEILIPMTAPRPSTYLGEGKVEELAELCAQASPEVVVFDGALSPVQQRNLEKALKAKVIDRTGLILEIFGERARTKEGRLQVELAHLNYQKSRLVRSWTHLERQRGGFGFLGGPGESQIETDRRLIGERIAKIRKELEETVRTRDLHRTARRRVPYPIAALVGYTNAGKSTLFNAMTRAEVLAEDMLFATLDPTMRSIKLPGGRSVVLSDTVGIISDLPTQLVAAFRATLEEVLEADLILHVRDISHPDSEAQRQDVEAVLTELGIEGERLDQVVEVWNKVDALSAEDAEAARRRGARPGPSGPVVISAITGEGIDALKALMERRLSDNEELIKIVIRPEDGQGLAWAYSHASVRGRAERKDGSVELKVSVPREKEAQFRERFPVRGRAKPVVKPPRSRHRKLSDEA
ncbi:MAG: GTPase HflX [Alphaproteobacteria bacterium]|nr:GTPase HflX [Alphaproteobacteria bacterium]